MVQRAVKRIEWTDANGTCRSAEVSHLVPPIVEAIGIDATAELLLSVGGSQVYISVRSNGGLVEQAIGEAAANALGRALGYGSLRLPTARPFLAKVLRGRGLGTAEIARTLHTSDTSVRGYLRDKVTVSGYGKSSAGKRKQSRSA